MRAVVCTSYGPPENLQIAAVDEPRPEPHEVLIEIYAAGINFPDTLQIQGKYQFQPPFPFTPGFEVAGKIAEVGSQVTAFKPGDRVMASTSIGGMAEAVAAPANTVWLLPDSMDLITAAGFCVTYGTSYHALKQRAALAPGESLLVLGASGGVGLAAVEIGKAMGATVIAAASTDEKLRVAENAGADHLINYADAVLKERVKEITGGSGADVIYDPVGGDMFDQATRAINWKGRLLVVGFASGRIPQYPVNLALLKGCQLVGVFWGSFLRREPEVNEQNVKELFQLYAEGKLKPLVREVYPLEQYAAALNRLVGRQSMGKVVFQVRTD